MDKYELESGYYYNKHVNNFSMTIIFTSIILLPVLVLLFLILPHESPVKLKGMIEPISVVETIEIDIKSKIKQKYYFEGQEVKKGQMLALFEEPTNRIVKIKAKKSGLVHLLNKANRKSEIIEIYPKLEVNKKVKIRAYLPSNDVSLVKKGQDLILTIKQIDTLKTVISGKISKIGKKPITIKNKKFYLVEAHTKLSDKQAKIIRYGMKGDAIIILKKENSLYYSINKLLRSE